MENTKALTNGDLMKNGHEYMLAHFKAQIMSAITGDRRITAEMVLAAEKKAS